MIKEIMNLDKDIREQLPEELDIDLSIAPFIRFIEEKTRSENKFIRDFYISVLDKLQQYPELWHPITVERLLELHEILDIIYACISTYSSEGEDELFAFGVPFKSQVFYYTKKWKELLIDSSTHELKDNIEISWVPDTIENLKIYFYKVILDRFYGFTNLLDNKNYVYTVRDTETGLDKFYKAEINIDFLDIIPKGELPNFNIDIINENLNGENNFLVIEKYLPLSRFKISGLNLIRIVDVTIEESIHQMEHDILQISQCEQFRNITSSIQNLLGSREIHLGYFPIIKLNGKIVLDNVNQENDVLFLQNVRSTSRTEEYTNIINWFIDNPRNIFFRKITEDVANRHPSMLFLTQKSIASYAMIPIFFNRNVIGILELYSKKEGVLDEKILTRLDRAVPTLSYLMQVLTDNFHNRITEIIRNRYTALQPVVQWKFNEIAFKQMLWQNNNTTQPFSEKIHFQEVYPLYTAIDIKDSTIKRNAALQQDLSAHFKHLLECLDQLGKIIHLSLIDNILYQAKQFELKISHHNEFSSIAEITEFINTDVYSFLLHIQKSYPETARVIRDYFNATDPETGEVYKNRKALEHSIKTINEQLEKSIEILTNDIHDQYPFYFEKFRTDGIEYDIYIGQSLVPSKPFSNLYLKNLRLWQLISTTIMARQTNEIIRDLPVKLETTSLILVYDSPIDIVFRNDERRFDIDGVYNLRYQMIKKRIDKAVIKDTHERLTQPGKLSIVYYNPKNETEYIYYLQFLIEKGLLLNDIEKFELRDMQGISGLKAFRVGINYD